MFRSMAPYGRIRTLQALALLLVFCTLLSTFRPYRQFQLRRPPSIYEYTEGKTRGAAPNGTNTDATPPPSDETAYFRTLVQEYGLTNEVPWFARRIRPRFVSGARKSITEIAGTKFLSQPFQRARASDEHLDLHAEKPLEVPVPRSSTPDQVDASALLFGISTSYDRLMYGNASLLRDWTRWLTDGRGRSNGASLVLTLYRATTAQISRIEDMLQDTGIDAVVLPAEGEGEGKPRDGTARYLDLVHLLTRRREELKRDEGREKKFLGLVDDDVFFPSLGALLTRLGKYNAAKEAYIGLPSERADWMVDNGTVTTYGGGAVFFTPPIAERVVQLPCFNSTGVGTGTEKEKMKGAEKGKENGKGMKIETRTGQWDETLYNCITAYTDSKLHILPSLYAPSKNNDPSLHSPQASYDSGMHPLTLHHYKHRHRFEARKAHLVTSICGEACFLQRIYFPADGWVLVNGHSVAEYPDGVAVASAGRQTSIITDTGDKSKGKTESGMGINENLILDEHQHHQHYNDGYTSGDRKVVSWAGVKRTWHLVDARAGARGGIWQAYVKRKGASSSAMYGDEGDRLLEGDAVHAVEGPADVDSVVVVIWEV